MNYGGDAGESESAGTVTFSEEPHLWRSQTGANGVIIPEFIREHPLYIFQSAPSKRFAIKMARSDDEDRVTRAESWRGKAKHGQIQT